MENNKINIAEILRECPPGMELDCTMYDNCTFDGIEDVGYTEILVKTPSGRIRLTKEGCFTHSDEYAKCVIFPKGKTNWKGFIPPCKFKDGDVVCLERHCDKVLTIAIFKGIENNYLHTYTYTSPGSICFSVSSFNIDYIKDLRFASLEEKEKLFEELEHHGYRWNLKTKTLEKLVEPKFKVGDKIVHCERGGKKLTIDGVYKTLYGTKELDYGIPIENQDNWELVPNNIVPKFKVGDRIKYRDEEIIYRIVKITEDTYELDNHHSIPISVEYEYMYDLVPNKFDISTLIPYESKVLIRNTLCGHWEPAFWGAYTIDHSDGLLQHHDYLTTKGFTHYCIPYEGNEHLIGKTDDCIEYYKTWED